MWIAYVVAAVVAMAAGYKAAVHPSLPYWRRWDAVAVRVALTPIYALHALAGIAVTGLAIHLGWVPLDSGAGRQWLNGAVYGVAAAALLRLEITSFGLSPLSPARALLKVGLETFAPRLDAAVAVAVSRRIGDLPREALCRVAWRLFIRHVEPVMTPGDALTLAARLRETHASALADPRTDPAVAQDAVEAVERLREFCESLILEHRDATIELGGRRVPAAVR